MMVSLKDAQGFANVWRHNGVAIPLQDTHLEFAKDFANIVLKSFIERAQQQAMAAAQRAAEQQQQRVVLAEG